MRFDLLHPADQLVMMMDRIYYRGMTTTSGGNLSIKDENGDVWMTPSGIDKGMLKREDIMLIKKDGTIEGRHKPSSEYPFHLSVYEMREDIGAVLHAHSPGMVAFSIVRKLPSITLLPNIKGICGELAIADYAVPGSDELGQNIGKKFAEGYNTVLLENHGLVIGAADIWKAFQMFETIETSALLEINASKLGGIRELSKEEILSTSYKSRYSLSEFIPDRHSSEENAARRDLIKLIHRSYDMELFTSTQGTYSVCLGDGSFIITPYGKDRKYLEIQDLVLIKDGYREAGKLPSRSVRLHQEIYETSPEVKSILLAHPPNIMAFAVTDRTFDPKTIPESYIMLREIKKIPYGDNFLKIEETAKKLTPQTPVLICENDCVIVTGNSLLNAFDRLEVAEFTAKSIIQSHDLGAVVHISDE
ncbi:MAG: class II aldolase/adducin family protein, partial [Clostridiaceae bacterium]|nr:class II aldolase/adducin family protein [Clostridiaceae bacterium]